MVGTMLLIKFDYLNHPLVTPERVRDAVRSLQQVVEAAVVMATNPDKDDAGRPVSCTVWVQSTGTIAALVQASIEQQFVTKVEVLS